MERSEQVLHYWFGEPGDGWHFDEGRLAFWFGKNPAIDAEIKRLFEADIGRAAAREYRQWSRTPRGRLAQVILLDQFPRNIYRGTPRALEYDPLALGLCSEGLALGDDLELKPIERVFFYLPLEHSEDFEDQRRAVMHFARLFDAAPPEAQPAFATFLEYARRHEAIIERFGRFPHRNRVLGRSSTPDEEAFLLQPGSSF